MGLRNPEFHPAWPICHHRLQRRRWWPGLRDYAAAERQQTFNGRPASVGGVDPRRGVSRR